MALWATFFAVALYPFASFATETLSVDPPLPIPPDAETPSIPGQSYQPLLLSMRSDCWSSQLKSWIAAQPKPPDSWAIARQGNEIFEACKRTIKVPDDSPRQTNPIGPCEGTKISNPAGDSDKDNLPKACQTRASSGGVINWLRVHKRGGNYGETPDPMFSKLRPSDGHVAIYCSLLSKTAAGTEVSIDEQLEYFLTPRPQDDPPPLCALLHKRDDRYKIVPLNYAAGDSSRVDIPVNLPQLEVAYDAASNKYLVYGSSNTVSFLTPSWNRTLFSWEHFYVWWFDARDDKIERRLLPPGPWVADAKNDGIERATRNFSCGTDCYRKYEISVVKGTILVTITGRLSAIAESVLGTYKLGKSDSKWEKIKDGKPIPASQ
jgi:hypothetical protein